VYPAHTVAASVLIYTGCFPCNLRDIPFNGNPKKIMGDLSINPKLLSLVY